MMNHITRQIGQLSVMDFLPEELQNFPDCVPDVVTYNAIIDVYARTGHCGKAAEWMEKMIAAGIKPCQVTYGTVQEDLLLSLKDKPPTL